MQAFDSEGNVFTSLQGFRFDWEIPPNSLNLEIVSFAEAGFKTTPVRHTLENGKIQSDICFVKGTKTGHSKIQVKLSEKGYDNISSGWID